MNRCSVSRFAHVWLTAPRVQHVNRFKTQVLAITGIHALFKHPKARERNLHNRPMRWQTKRTDSQQQLALHLGIEPKSSGLLSRDHRRLLIHGARTAIAAALSWRIALAIGLHDGYWGAISAIIVLQSNFGATITASRDRLLGTLIGAAFGFAFSLIGVPPWNFIAAVLAAVLVCGLMEFRSSSRLAGVTIAIIMLVPATSSHWTLALHRVIEVLIGILMAIVASTVIFPDRARFRLRDGLAQEFLLLSKFFTAILEGFSGPPSTNLTSLRQDVLATMRNNNQLLDAARNEPAGGPGWREGQEMLSQFGRSLLDTLIALEYSVKDSHNDAYAQHLEPALGKLAADIAFGFLHVAGCIHNWRFHVPPPGVNLEEDIAQLEERMNAARPKGMEFSQAEILRAYAVQLHLKQLARILRASRVETSRALGELQP